jgi:hypothetical protein
MDAMKRCPYCAEEVLAAAVKCKHCGSELSVQPPAAAKKQTVIRWPFKIMGALILLLLGIAAVFAFIQRDDPRYSVPQRAIFETTASDLSSRYDTNEVATDQQIGNAVVEVTGTIKSIDKDFTDAAIIVMATDDYHEAIFALDAAYKAPAGQLSRGQKITIRCGQMRRVLSSPRGDDCVIVK